ncbi:MAG: GtrA family protein [Candidatus Falkowbacteria bacterium]|nr:GtrA family protein [Candidatus Falkowbacteria bacterium]
MLCLKKPLAILARAFWALFNNKKMHAQFVKFALIGVLNTLIDFCLYFLLTRYIPFFSYRSPNLYLANGLSFLSATTFSFFANRFWTFAITKKPSVTEAGRFYIITLSGLFINSLFLYIGIKILNINDLLAKAIATIFYVLWNFGFLRTWVFRKS